MSRYLFVFFTGEQKDGEQIYFAVSQDGMHWEDLNCGQPVLRSHIGEKGVRDPFMVRDTQNGKFYLMATDLCIGNGTSWEKAQYGGSRDLIVWESEDLVHWSAERRCSVGVPGAGCVWAPESIYDEEKGEFFVFWASMVKGPEEAKPKQKIYGAYTKDFRTFSKTSVYLERENHVIDMNIVKDGDWYYRFVKNESSRRVGMDRVRRLTDQAEVIPSEVLDHMEGVEGPEGYRLPDGRWCLIVDQFAAGRGYLPLISDDLAGGVFSIPGQQDYDLGKLKKRHGCVLQITDEEYDRLKE